MSIDVVTFGCRLNSYESEVMKREAEAAGLKDAILINTCAVTNEAVRQARQAVRKAKRDNPGARVIVGIRPQDMDLTAGSSPLRLDIRERLGGVAYDYLTAPTGERLIVETKGDTAMDEGTEVTVSFDETRAMFFDAETEARLR